MKEQYTGSDNLEVMLEAENYNQFLMEMVREFAPETGTALDFGAGIGTFTRALPLVRDCIEPDRAAGRQLRSAGYRVFEDIADLGSERYDYIFSLNVLEHIEDDLAAAKALVAHLRPGGRILIYVPAFNHLRTSMDDLVGHHRRYTRSALVELMQSAGLQVEQAAYTDFLGYFATWVFRLLDLFKRRPSGRINSRMLVVYDRLAFPVSRLLSIPFARIMGKNVFAVGRLSG